MQIRKLKLSGFKSFVEPSELRIEPGLTGVVGPNGCGKSNLLEAIRWVMGENSPKSMRSGGMDDVIFAGTAQRPPRDFAEVVLHAKDDAGEDLDVTRRIERGAARGEHAIAAHGITDQRDARRVDAALRTAERARGQTSGARMFGARAANSAADRRRQGASRAPAWAMLTWSNAAPAGSGSKRGACENSTSRAPNAT